MNVLHRIVGLGIRPSHGRHRDDIVEVMLDGVQNRHSHGGDTKRFLMSEIFFVKNSDEWLRAAVNHVIWDLDDGPRVGGITFEFWAVSEPKEEDLQALERMEKGGMTFFLESYSGPDAERYYENRYARYSII